MKNVDIYTDGSCLGNPGNGGWAAIVIENGKETEFFGNETDTTNNRMELTAVIKGLESLRNPCNVKLYSDSKYICDAINKGWVFSWQRKGWKKSDGKPALNVDLWEKILNLISQHEVVFMWVQGHAGNKYNERCDKLATSEAANIKTNKNNKSQEKQKKNKQPYREKIKTRQKELYAELALLLPKAEFAGYNYDGDDIDFVKMRLRQLVEVSKKILLNSDF